MDMDIRIFFSKKPRLQNEEQAHASTSEEAEIGEIPSEESSISKNTSSTNAGFPDDIAQIGEPIKQVTLDRYPRGGKNRAFVADWFKRYKWLQYSVKNDAAFCYPCQQFLPHGSKQTTYTKTGFRNWKNATDLKCGFPKHEKTISHIQAMTMWEDKIRRITTSCTVGTLLNENILEQNRYYVKSIVEVIQFLAINELGFRGNYTLDEEREQGLFNNLFEYTVKKDPALKNIIGHIPQNAKYRSPQIQNQIVQAMVKTVRECIVKDIQESDVPWFTLMEDGTRDKNNRENIAIAIRYVKGGIVKESLLTVTTTRDLDAATFTDATLNILKENNIDLKRLLSQCYDGASVMSGKISGVAARIEKEMNRRVPYVHCYNHRLHLVVVRTISDITFIHQFFYQCIMLHEFLQHGKVASLYEGKTIGRLLEQRWSGHLAVTKGVYNNYGLILKCLREIKNQKFSGDDIAKSVGIKTVMLSMKFRMALLITKKILCILDPADAALQGRTTSLKNAISIIQCVQKEICNLRSDEIYKSILKEAENLVEEESEDVLSRKRQVKVGHLENFILCGPSSLRRNTETGHDTEQFRPEFFETIDLITAELKRRFSENDELLASIAGLDELDAEKMRPLQDLGKSLIKHKTYLMFIAKFNKMH